ncbi:hypothetical protein HY385_01340 [Candidatus Daviesbacteria bacterium]|nr:hypothetical protein [Candidatus Daviesbacteria bacterium]
MLKFKKVILVGLTGIAGLLLTLAGLNLIQLSDSLILYSGLSLLILAILMYFLN